MDRGKKYSTQRTLTSCGVECLLRLWGVQVTKDAECPDFSLRASAVFRTIPEDNKKWKKSCDFKNLKFTKCGVYTFTPPHFVNGQ